MAQDRQSIEFSYDKDLNTIIRANINKFFKNCAGFYMIKMDEIAIKPKCVWLHRTNDIVGFCFNHVPKFFDSCQFVNQYSLNEFKHRFTMRDDGERDIQRNFQK